MSSMDATRAGLVERGVPVRWYEARYCVCGHHRDAHGEGGRCEAIRCSCVALQLSQESRRAVP